MMNFKLGKKILLTSLLVLSLNGVVSAQTVIVDGVGVDLDSAKRDASRNAVEQVVGTFIDSQTIVQDMSVKLDEIYTKSQGFVTDIKVLNQSNDSGMVRVRAQIDVNTNPDAQLMNTLNMIMMLNDPRIAVVVFRQDAQGNAISHDNIAEAELNNKLLELGFSHVIDAGIASSLQNAQLLNNIYNGHTNISSIGQSLGADYLVIGRSRMNSQSISLPDGNGGYAPTLLKTGNATLTVKIIRFDTGDITGTFTTSAKGVENSNEMAEEQALTKAAGQAAQKLEEKFRHMGSVTGQALQFEVFTNDSNAVNQLVTDLKAMAGVQNVYLREQQNGKAILSVDTTMKPAALVQQLKNSTSLGIFVAGMAGNSVKLSISR